MAKSRMALLVLAAGAAGPAFAQQSTAETLVERQRQALREAMRLDCRPSEDPDDIVVCGSREEERRYRLEPLPGPAPGVASEAGGEQRAAMNNDRCLRLCPSQVGVAVNPIELILHPRRVLRRILEPLE